MLLLLNICLVPLLLFGCHFGVATQNWPKDSATHRLISVSIFKISISRLTSGFQPQTFSFNLQLFRLSLAQLCSSLLAFTPFNFKYETGKNLDCFWKGATALDPWIFTFRCCFNQYFLGFNWVWVWNQYNASTADCFITWCQLPILNFSLIFFISNFQSLSKFKFSTSNFGFNLQLYRLSLAQLSTSLLDVIT